MTISFVGAASNASTSVDISGLGIQPGDLLVVFAASASATKPTIPSGWTPALARSPSTGVLVVATRPVITGSETVTGFTGAVAMIAACYRDSVSYLAIGGVSSATYTTTTSANFVSIPDYATSATSATMWRGQGDSWAVGVATCNVLANGLSTAPSGMTHRSAVSTASREIALHDSAGNLTLWTMAATTLSGSASGGTMVVEIYDTGVPKSSGSGGIARLINGGLVRGQVI